MDIEKMNQIIIDRLPVERRQVLDRLYGEFSPTDTLKLIIALVAATSRRERQILRLMMADIEKIESDKNE